MASGTQVNRRLHNATGIETSAHFSRQWLPSCERGGMVESTVATQELRAIARPLSLTPAEIDKGYTAAELTVPGVACQHGSCFCVNLSDNKGGGDAPRHTKHPLDVRGYREPSRSARVILNRQARNLDWIITRNKLQELKRHTV